MTGRIVTGEEAATYLNALEGRPRREADRFAYDLAYTVEQQSAWIAALQAEVSRLRPPADPNSVCVCTRSPDPGVCSGCPINPGSHCVCSHPGMSGVTS